MTGLEAQMIKLFDKHRDRGFTSSDVGMQLKKLCEEVGEFVEAAVDANRLHDRGLALAPEEDAHLIEEAGDVACMLVDILHTLNASEQLNRAMSIVYQKLVDRHEGESAYAD